MLVTTIVPNQYKKCANDYELDINLNFRSILRRSRDLLQTSVVQALLKDQKLKSLILLIFTGVIKSTIVNQKPSLIFQLVSMKKTMKMSKYQSLDSEQILT